MIHGLFTKYNQALCCASGCVTLCTNQYPIALHGTALRLKNFAAKRLHSAIGHWLVQHKSLRTAWTGGRFSMRGSLLNLYRASLYVRLAVRCFIMSSDAYLDLGFNKNML